MCLLLVYISANPAAGRYKLILVSNRDEYFLRPALPAHFWASNPEILAGMDMTPGKEGGTWLGSSKSGRIGVLLNVSSRTSTDDKLGRGFIVTDYLGSNQSTEQHLAKLLSAASTYNPFHLVAIDLKESKPLRHFCNVNPKVTEFEDGFHAFCNSDDLSKPYRKATEGVKKMQDIVELFRDKKEELVSGLVSLLRDEHRYYPDPVIDSLTTVAASLRAPISAVCVREGFTYGTRTHTVILVEHSGQCDFYEWTLKVPIVNQVMEWVESHHKFQIPL